MARGTRLDLKKEKLWRRRLRAQAGSGLSVRAWCQQHDTRESAFYWWQARVARRHAAAPLGPARSPAPRFAPVQVVADVLPRAAGGIEIVLPGERCVHIVGRVERQMLVEVLAALIREPLGYDPLSGHLFLLVGRDKDRIKILYWDADGFAIWYKRLEEGTFRLPVAPSAGTSMELKASELAMLLAGIDLTSIKRRRRFAPRA